MAGNTILVINAAGAETRVALVENGTIHEYYLERKREKGIVGNIYKGRVVRVLPGMQAAFVDIGLEKAAFLYVGDVYGDPDFSEEFELTEGEHAQDVSDVPSEQEAEEQEVKALAGAPESPLPALTPLPGELPVALPAEAGAAGEPAAAPPAGEPAASGTAAPGASEATAEPGAVAPAGETPILLTRVVEPGPAAPAAPGAAAGAGEASPARPVEPGAPALPQGEAGSGTAPVASGGLAAASPAEAPAAGEPGPASGRIAARPEQSAREARGDRDRPDRDRGDRGDRERGDRDRGERGDRERDRGERGRGDERRDDRKDDRKRNRNGRGAEERRPKETKNIQDLLKEGQEVIVQVAKDPIGTKGARITSHISIPGRHLVFMPTVDHIGISRRIEKEGERRRLREIVDRMRPEGTGFIVRTVADGVEAQKLEADIRFLIQVWNEIIRTKDKVSPPALLHPDLDLILRATRDLFTADVNKLVIDDRDEYERILRFVREQAPHLESQIELYAGEEPIFDAYGIEQELKRAGQRKVWLKSGGYIIIDQAEALTAIDVNSGRYVGKKNLEETITKINVEASKEIVYQLRLRNIGGIIIIDFIDMDKPQNRDKVFKALQDALGRDKAKTNVLKISELGLVEMTRKRVRESITRMTTEPCGYCEGKGHIRSKVTVAYEIFREIRRDAHSFHEGVLVVNCHPEVARILQGSEREELRYLMDRFNKTIQVKPQGGYHGEQFDIYGRSDRGEGEGRGRRDRDRGGRSQGGGDRGGERGPGGSDRGGRGPGGGERDGGERGGRAGEAGGGAEGETGGPGAAGSRGAGSAAGGASAQAGGPDGKG
jgi:ribonuclease G